MTGKRIAKEVTVKILGCFSDETCKLGNHYTFISFANSMVLSYDLGRTIILIVSRGIMISGLGTMLSHSAVYDSLCRGRVVA